MRRLISIAAAALAVSCLTVAVALDVPAQVVSLAALDKVTTAATTEMKGKYQRPSAIPFPAENPYTQAKYQLGEMLFFEPRLSGSNYISCANCHNPSLSWGDGLPRGIGHGMTILGRRTPTVLNLAWSELLMWDGRKETLEEQALGPIQASVEMNQDIESLVKKLSEIEEYRAYFDSAFPGEGISGATIGKAIATYERMIVSGIAPFDRWASGDESAISDSAKRGFTLFNTKANCAACHSGWNFTDNSFHDIGLPSTDIGRFEHLPLERMKHAFKTPTLRDIERRAPYMHDGSVKTLDEVMRHYDMGGLKRDSLSHDMKPLGLSDTEIADVIAFMRTLTSDEEKNVRIPRLPTSVQRPVRSGSGSASLAR